MSQSELSPEIKMHVEGEVSGQVAAGLYNVQIGSVQGGVVNINQQGQPTIQPKARPVRALPRRIGWYVNREQEYSTATRILEELESVEFRGRPGMGKTVLLRRLTHDAADFPDGIVYSRIHDRPVADILQELFDRFYEAGGANYKPRHGQLLDALQSVEALIVLDDVEVEREAMDDLFNALPGCTFLLASTEQRLWGGEGREIVLKGLAAEDALELVERELDRKLEEDEREAAKELAAALEGHPQSILQAAARIRDEGATIAEIGRRLQESVATLGEELLDTLSEGEREVLAILTSLEGTPLHEEHIDALARGEDIKAILDKLLARRLIQAHSPEYSIAPNLVEPLQEALDVAAWPEVIAARLISWGRTQRDNPNLILRDAPTYQRILTSSSQEGRWQEALDLALVVEGSLAIGKRWMAWSGALEAALRAARELGSEPAEALALHQLGTRALLLDEKYAARKHFAAALRIRKGLGDDIGAAVTGHNLSHLSWLAIIPPILAETFLMIIMLAVPAVVALFLITNAGSQSPATKEGTGSGDPPSSNGTTTHMRTPGGSAQPGLSLTDDARPLPAAVGTTIDPPSRSGTLSGTPTTKSKDPPSSESLLTTSPPATTTATASATASTTPSATPTTSPTHTPTATATATPTATSTATSTATPTATPTPTGTPEPPYPPPPLPTGYPYPAPTGVGGVDF